VVDVEPKPPEKREKYCLVTDPSASSPVGGEQAEALGWTARDLFGLQTPPAKSHPSYSRLSRYDETGLIWLLQGRQVVALTETTAAIQNPTGAINPHSPPQQARVRSAAGNITIYRKHNKPALGPLGDSLDDLQ
jgi:hypothetical protein